ncbi:MAG: hypothetical protein ACXQS5_00550 [Candidatus Methanospirareceae archaeon]
MTINEEGGGEGNIDTDELLMRKLSKAGIATVYLRGKSRLEEGE